MKERGSVVTDELINDLKLKGFKAYKVETVGGGEPNYARLDFFKIALLKGRTLLKYTDKKTEVNGTYLFFGNPHLPYISDVQGAMSGYACVFTEKFLKTNDHRYSSQQDSVLYKLAVASVIKVNAEQSEFLSILFKRVIAEFSTEYIYKDELIRNYISLLIQEGVKLNPVDNQVSYKNASNRLAFMFLEMLERQFPVESVKDVVKLRTAQDFANQLNVHVNYLNRAVKEVTGKSTTSHITERIVTEAKALLQYTNWSIAEIAYSLGFEYTTYFNKFFKKNTGSIPKAYRIHINV